MQLFQIKYFWLQCLIENLELEEPSFEEINEII